VLEFAACGAGFALGLSCRLTSRVALLGSWPRSRVRVCSTTRRVRCRVLFAAAALANRASFNPATAASPHRVVIFISVVGCSTRVPKGTRQRTNPRIEVRLERREEHRIIQQRLHPRQLDRQHQLSRQDRLPQRRLVGLLF